MIFYKPSFPPAYERKTGHNIDYQNFIKDEILQGMMIRKNLESQMIHYEQTDSLNIFVLVLMNMVFIATLPRPRSVRS
jgi:hypothetical protein